MDGILLVDKPKGYTSHDLVDFIRKNFYIKKVGHAGTLDPQATGLLVILIGKYTKRSREFSRHDKEYEACLTLGLATDSQDAEGRIIARQDVPNFNKDKIKHAFNQFLGDIEQIPSMFSALRYKGKRMYKLARQGLEVPRPVRKVQIYSLEINKIKLPHVYFTVRCSKGTYIRTLCHDIAERLNCVGYMSELRRIGSGPFSLAQAFGINQINFFSRSKLEQAIICDF